MLGGSEDVWDGSFVDDEEEDLVLGFGRVEGLEEVAVEVGGSGGGFLRAV